MRAPGEGERMYTREVRWAKEGEEVRRRVSLKREKESEGELG